MVAFLEVHQLAYREDRPMMTFQVDLGLLEERTMTEHLWG